MISTPNPGARSSAPPHRALSCWSNSCASPNGFWDLTWRHASQGTIPSIKGVTVPFLFGVTGSAWCNGPPLAASPLTWARQSLLMASWAFLGMLQLQTRFLAHKVHAMSFVYGMALTCISEGASFVLWLTSCSESPGFITFPPFACAWQPLVYFAVCCQSGNVLMLYDASCIFLMCSVCVQCTPAFLKKDGTILCVDFLQS